MPFSKRIQELKQQRAANRRQAKLDQRAADELERLKEEERREQARLEYEEMETALDAAKARRDALLTRLRAQKMNERKAAERAASRQADIIDLLRQATILANRDQAAQSEKAAEKKERQAEEEKAAQREAARREKSSTTRIEDEKPPAGTASQSQEKLAASKKERQTAEQRAAARNARLEERRQTEQENEKAAGAGEAALQARLARQQEDEKRAAAHEAQLDKIRSDRKTETASRVGEPDRQAETEKQQKNAEERRAARLEGDRQAEKDRLQADERRAASQAERLTELRKAEEERQLADERRASSQAERLAELRQVEEARQKTLELQQARLEERRQADQLRQQADERRRNAAQTRLTQRAEAEKARQAANTRRISQAAQRQADAQKEFARRAARVLPPRNPLQDPLASGALSGELPWLRASGSLITSITGDPILLRGVNLLGLDSAAPDPQRGFAAGAGITPEVIDTILSWGANVIRVAINRARVLDGAGDLSSQDYLRDLDSIIQQAAQGGAYTLLSLRRLDEESIFGTLPGSAPNYIAPQPGFDHFDMWRVLGERYALEPAVLYDLYTAPHAPLPDDASGIESSWDLWSLWVEMSVADLRRVHPGALCFVSGLAGGADLSGFPFRGTANRPIPNLVYTTQIYPRKENPWQAIQSLARAHPLFVSEWGGQPLETSWGERAAQLMRGSGIGWAAAHWNGQPSLTTVLRNQLYPSTFGALVRRALALEGEILAATQPADPNTLPTLSFF